MTSTQPVAARRPGDVLAPAGWWCAGIGLLAGPCGVLLGASIGRLVGPGAALRDPRPELARTALVTRVMAWAIVVGVALGGAAGLALGLSANPPTAWFAVIEGAVAGMTVSLPVGGLWALLAALLAGRRR